VSITTTRLTPSASGLAQAVFAGAGVAGGLIESEAVTSTSSRAGLAAAASRSRCGLS